MRFDLRPLGIRHGILLDCLLGFACCSVGLAQVGGSAAAPPNFQPNPQARELVRKIVANELKQEELDKAHYMFKLKKISPKENRVQEIVQTDQGSIARTLLI